MSMQSIQARRASEGIPRSRVGLVRPPNPRSHFHPAAWTRALLAPALVFIATAVDRNYQTDFWHHLARGRAMAAEGGLVDRDLFTYTVPGRPFQDTNWLTQLFYYFLYEHGGLALVQVVN